MWDCCFIKLFSYGKLPYDYNDQSATERNTGRASYEDILEKIWARDHIDLRYTVPRAWPPFSYLTEEEMQQLADSHRSAPPLKGIMDCDFKLVRRLLYYTRQDLWFSESDKEWHYPLLLTLRDKDRKNWRNRSIEAWAARWEKERNRKQGKGKHRTIQSIAFCVGIQS